MGDIDDDIVEKSFRKIPHIQLRERIISINWKLDFVLPYAIRVKEEKLRSFLRKIKKEDGVNREKEYKSFMKDMENWDNFIASIKCEGITLTEPGIAQIIQSTFNFYDNKLYDLHCYCIMPNHIHLLIKPLTDEKGESYHLSDIIKRIKTYTAKMINQELKRTGKVWEDDYFDRIIRNEQDYYNVINYYLKNPVKAGLVDYIKDWEYSYFKFG